MSEYNVLQIVNGAFKQNCFILADDQNFTIILDPGSDAPQIIEQLEKHNLTPIAIINTHGHFDHIGAVAELTRKYSIPFYIHEADVNLVKSANIYRLLFKTKAPITIPEIGVLILAKTSHLSIGNFDFEVIQTPGHTPGGVCFKIANFLFTGDTLMPKGPGTTRLPGGDANQLNNSIETLRQIESSVLVYPGHGHPLKLVDIWKKYDAS